VEGLWTPTIPFQGTALPG
jgi:hypothetical protein